MEERFKAEEIVMKLREVELAINKGMDAAQACRQAGVSEQSYYPMAQRIWWNEVGSSQEV